MKIRHIILFTASLLGAATPFISQASETEIAMTVKASMTLYVTGWMLGAENTEFLVDTGASYMTINEDTLHKLQAEGQAEYQRELRGILANGDEMVVPVYRIPKIVLGERCELADVEAAVFPGKSRQLLGLSVLRKASPFLFSVDPPTLHLSNCIEQISEAETAVSEIEPQLEITTAEVQ